MSERFGSSARFTITLEEVMARPDLKPQYFEERVAAVKRGEEVWIAHGIGLPHKENSIRHYYYQDGKSQGFVVGNDLDGYHIYVPPVEEDDDHNHHLNAEPKMLLSEAQKSLVDYINGTSH